MKNDLEYLKLYDGKIGTIMSCTRCNAKCLAREKFNQSK